MIVGHCLVTKEKVLAEGWVEVIIVMMKGGHGPTKQLQDVNWSYLNALAVVVPGLSNQLPLCTMSCKLMLHLFT